MAQVLGLATASSSLGKPQAGHYIKTILDAAAVNGIKGIEICYEALLSHAASLGPAAFPESVGEPSILQAAKDIKEQCNALDLVVIVLQPFASYEGLIDAEKHRRAVRRWSHWLAVTRALGCDTIQMPSNFELVGTTGDFDKIVADLIEIADLALAQSPPVRIAYEAVAWGTHFDLWEQSWDIVNAVDGPNFGLCLDTFHIAGRVWGDPTSAEGMTSDADVELAASMSRLVRHVDVTKVFYVQLSDAEKLSVPLAPGHPLCVEGQPCRMTWSRAARLFPCEKHLGGYLPVLEIAHAIVNRLGYRGWISMEIFSRHLSERHANIPTVYAKRAALSYQAVYEKLGWEEFRTRGMADELDI
jgi:4-hydroxyphenylpyruvate dioxygenase